MAFHFSPKVVTDGLVLYLDAANYLSYVSGSTAWNDLTENGSNGTLTNGPTFSSANGGSLVFDGIDDYVDLSTYSNNSIWDSLWPNGISINAVFRFTTLTHDSSILSRLQMNVALYNWFNFSLSNVSSIPKLRFWIGSFTPAFTNTTISAGVIYHAIVTWDRSNVRFYVNGIPDSTTPCTNILTNGESSIFRLGSSLTLPTFPGNIYNLSVYDRALTDQEALQNFNALKSRYGL
jgi:hypothetical protein